MPDRSLSPPTVTDADKPLRREVAMAYRTAREAGLSHHHALDVAQAAYFQVHPDALANRLEASTRVNEMIASAIQVDPQWFWKNVRAQVISAQPYRG
jgi:lambda repressor-like predicted transcriptional regulator